MYRFHKKFSVLPKHPRIPFSNFHLFHSDKSRDKSTFQAKNHFPIDTGKAKGIVPFAPPDPNSDESTLLYQSILAGDRNKVYTMMRDNPDLALTNSYYFSCPPIHFAMEEGQWDIVNMFIKEFHISPSNLDLWGYTSIHYAAIFHSPSLYKLLEIIKPSPDFTLFDAHISRLKFNDPNQTKKPKQHHPFQSSGFTTTPAIVENVLAPDDAHYKYIHEFDIGGQTPMHLAALYQNFDSMVHLIDAGADPEKLNLANQTILTFLAQSATPQVLDTTHKFFKSLLKQSRTFLKSQENIHDNIYQEPVDEQIQDDFTATPGSETETTPDETPVNPIENHNEPYEIETEEQKRKQDFTTPPSFLTDIACAEVFSHFNLTSFYPNPIFAAGSTKNHNMWLYLLRDHLDISVDPVSGDNILHYAAKFKNANLFKVTLEKLRATFGDDPVSKMLSRENWSGKRVPDLFKTFSLLPDDIIPAPLLNKSNILLESIKNKDWVHVESLLEIPDKEAELQEWASLQDLNQNTALHQVAVHRHIPTLRRLLPISIDPTIQNLAGNTFLHTLLMHRIPIKLSQLDQLLADLYEMGILKKILTTQNYRGLTPLDIAASKDAYYRVVEKLFTHISEPPEMILHSLAKSKPFVLESFLSTFPDHASIRKHVREPVRGNTPYLSALSVCGHINALILKKIGENTRTRNFSGESAFHLMAQQLWTNMHKWLSVERQFIPSHFLNVYLENVTDLRGRTVLHYLCMFCPSKPLPHHEIRKINECYKDTTDYSFHSGVKDPLLSPSDDFIAQASAFKSGRSGAVNITIPVPSSNRSGSSGSIRPPKFGRNRGPGGPGGPGSNASKDHPMSESDKNVNQFFILYHLIHRRKISPFHQDDQGRTPLHYLADMGARESIHILLEGVKKYATPQELVQFCEVSDCNGNTALALALLRKKFSSMFLLSKYHQTNPTTTVNGSPIWKLLVDSHQWSFLVKMMRSKVFSFFDENVISVADCQWIMDNITEKTNESGDSLNEDTWNNIKSIMSMVQQYIRKVENGDSASNDDIAKVSDDLEPLLGDIDIDGENQMSV